MPLSGKRPPTSTQLASLDPSAKPAYLRVKIWRHVALKRFRSGGSGPQIFKYAAGDSRRTCLNTSRPCCCQSSARSSRKRLLNARRVASGDPPGFPVRLFFENTDGTPPLRHFTVVLNLINRPAASLIGIFTVTLNTGDFYGEIFPISSLDQIGPELSDGLRAIDRLHARRH